MADDQEKTEVISVLNVKGTRPFYYAKAAVATEGKSFQDFYGFF
ncbi:MAG: hypothetical protein U9Q62_10865 [Campylobacterota bacterium]|nr:hypothetical protein [Campylobacterota bacterium]